MKPRIGITLGDPAGIGPEVIAKALASGRKNERILCMNELSGRKILVRLTGIREATAGY